MKQSIELLAPAKNLEVGIEAIRHGADAVYIGGPGFGARAAAGNSVEDIRALCDYAHLFGARVYVTLNTILYDEELEPARLLVGELYEAGVDALITQDVALLTMDIPPIALHASTQMDNCTPERAQMLEAAGYSQIVLARELSLEQIRAIHNVTTLPLEAFVHGALCVSYSGRCYASQYCFGRSANRGRCAQFCRLPFDLVDAEGQVLEHDRHLLSLRDMNRSASLEEMMDAGVRSFKIEGRLKDAAYVKNVVAYYRQSIDDILKRRSEYVRASRGQQTTSFTPALAKSFNRGFTEYMLHERTADLWNFTTPKSMGEYVGRVERVGQRSFRFSGDVPVNNGDGLTFVSAEGRLEGFRANRVEGKEIFPLKMPALISGQRLYRNEDREWETLMARPTAERQLPVDVTLREDGHGFTLTMSLAAGSEQDSSCEADKWTATIPMQCDVQPAAKPQTENIIRNLSKLGGTPFVMHEVRIETNGERFIPSSVLAEHRRQLCDAFAQQLRQQHVGQRDLRRSEQKDSVHLDLSGQHFDYRSNVANRLARQWYQSHGAAVVDPAFEAEPPAKAALMTCRHCLRYALGQCPKQTGRKVEWKEPLSLRLADGRSFPLRFDCSRCEMQVLTPSSL